MNTNRRFAVSLHILTLLAVSDRPLTSEAIADSVDTNPVVIRRTMANLRQQGLVESRPGANGGWGLLNSPQQIRLCEVYRMIGREGVFAVHSHPNKHCRVGAHIKAALANVFAAAQSEMENTLDKFTVEDVLNNVLAKAGK